MCPLLPDEVCNGYGSFGINKLPVEPNDWQLVLGQNGF
jgi:hypothetical protein